MVPFDETRTQADTSQDETQHTQSSHEEDVQATTTAEGASLSGEDEHNNQNESDASHNEEDPHSQCYARIQQLEERLAYLSSDFTNYRRNIEKEKTRWKHDAQASILQDLLSVVDDIERAVADLESQELPEEAAKRLEGIQLIHKSMRKLLESYEVHEITQVETFDPQWHEAVMQVSETDVSSGNIVSVIQKGYTFKGELLRTTKVTVAA